MNTKYRFWTFALRLAMFTSLAGAMSITGCLNKIGRNINPCGTILACDPAEWDWMMHNRDYPNWSVDPTCTIPGQCGQWPPNSDTVGSGGGGGGTTTGGTTTGGTTTGGFGTGGFGTGGYGTGGGSYGGGYGGYGGF